MKKRKTKLPQKKEKVMNTSLAKTNSIVKASRPVPPAGAIAVYADTERYKFGVGVASQSSGRIYKISFDAALGSLCWKCSCPGCIAHGDCKHLRACGLKGRAYGKQLDFAKKHSFIG